MTSLVSTWSNNVHSLPENYIMPPERRPCKFAPICKDIPVIDLGSELGHSRADLVQEIIKASQELGMFQVINHGVSEDLMNETMNLYKEFFDMPIKDKERVFSDDLSQMTRLYMSCLHFAKEEVHYWKDTLKHPVHPVEDYKHTWPEKPDRYRDVIETYSTETRKLGLTILDLISKGLGLKEGYFEKELSKGQGMSINHYPICPNPSLAMGIGGHCDPNLITILQQEVYGLQIFKDGQWVGVDPLPNA